MPFLPALASVTAKIIASLAVWPEVMKFFMPSITKRSPRRTARVARLAASDPTCGSLSRKAASSRPEAAGRRNSSFCRTVP